MEMGIPMQAPAAPLGSPKECSDARVQTPLMAAAANGHREVAELLLAAGADVHVRNIDGWTALTFAAAAGHAAIIELLLLHGAGVDGAPA